MAIKFKSAPAPAAAENADQDGSLDFFALVEDGGKFNLVLLIVVVVIIYGIVVYLRSTPGYRITDIKVKRRAERDAAVKRTRTPAPPPAPPNEVTEQG